MSGNSHERSITTVASILLADGHGQEFDTYRELVMQENRDGTWIVFALRPKTVDAGDSEEKIVSGSIKVDDEMTIAFLSRLFSLLADPGAFSEDGQSP